jgi:hypothetical protein
MLQVAESKRKDRELDMKDQAQKFSQAQVLAEHKLKMDESTRAGLENHARLHHEINPPEVESPEEDELGEEPDEAVQELIANQSAMQAAFTQLMAQLTASNEMIAQTLAQAQKPQSMRVQKQADGSFVGIKEPIEGDE